MGEPLNRDLLARSLNWHGQELTNFVRQSSPAFVGAGGRARLLDGLDYRLYHSRRASVGTGGDLEDRGGRMLTHRFIAQNVDALFSSRAAPPEEQGRASSGGHVHHQADLPPLETFFGGAIDPDKRTTHFFELVRPGDVLACRVAAVIKAGMLLNVQCFLPVQGGSASKSRKLSDLRLRCFCPAEESVPPTLAGRRSHEKEDLVAAVVLDVRCDSQRLLVSMKEEGLPEEAQGRVKLGSLSSADLPPSFQMEVQAERDDLSFEECLDRSAGFINPANVDNLAAQLGLSTTGGACSLFDSLRHGFSAEEKAASLRRRQSAKWAFSHVASGIRYFKAGNSVEAFQCLNQALKIDPENVEGLVARGALYANNGGLEKAIDDFAAALKINPGHKNGRKYICETLVALARGMEDDGRNDDAVKAYQRILDVDPDHREALESVKYLTRKLQGNQDATLEMKDKIELLIKSDAKSSRRRKKRRSRRESSSSSGSSRSSSSSTRGSKRSSSRPPSRSSERRTDLAPSKAEPSARIDGVDNNPASSLRKQTSQENDWSLPVKSISNPVATTTSAATTSKFQSESNALPSFPPAPGTTLPVGYPTASFGYSVPPPGFPPFYQLPQMPSTSSDDAYEKAVQDFLEKTNKGGAGTGGGGEERREVRSRSRRSRSRSRTKSRERRKSRRRSHSSRGSSPKSAGHRRSREESDSPDSRRSKRRKRDRREESPKKDRVKDRSMEELIKMGFKENMDVDKFAERITNFLSKKQKSSSPSNSEPKVAAASSTTVSVEGLDIVVKDLHNSKRQQDPKREDRVMEVRAQVGKKEASLGRVASPGVRKVFNQSDDGDDDEDEDAWRRGIVKKSSADPRPTWKPKDRDSLQGVGHSDIRNSRTRGGPDRNDEQHGRRKGATGDKTEFIVKLNTASGMFTRMAESSPQPAGESRVVRKVDTTPSPPRDRFGRKSRSTSRSRSRGRSRGRSRRSRSRSRDGRSYRRSRSRSLNRNEAELEDMRKETEELVRERERIAKEREALMRGTTAREDNDQFVPRTLPMASRLGPKIEEETPAPTPPSTSSVSKDNSEWNTAMNSVLHAVGPSAARVPDRPIAATPSAASIIPGANSFEDIEAYIDAEKKRKRDQMKERNKEFAPRFNTGGRQQRWKALPADFRSGK